MNRIDTFLKKGKRFSVMQYFIWLKGVSAQKQRVYEIIYVRDEDGKPHANQLTTEEISAFKKTLACLRSRWIIKMVWYGNMETQKNICSMRLIALSY